MCDLCHDPKATPERVLDGIRADISAQRFTTVSIAGSARSAELSYTVGLTEHALPELVVTAVRHQQAVGLLRTWGDCLLDESAVLPGESLRDGWWVLEAVAVERPREHLLLADALYGQRLQGLQLAWADDRGLWPWEPGHRARRAGQPLLGRRAPQYCCEHSPTRLDVPPHL